MWSRFKFRGEQSIKTKVTICIAISSALDPPKSCKRHAVQLSCNIRSDHATSTGIPIEWYIYRSLQEVLAQIHQILCFAVLLDLVRLLLLGWARSCKRDKQVKNTLSAANQLVYHNSKNTTIAIMFEKNGKGLIPIPFLSNKS